MKLIGITGKAGSGKTTLSNMLQEYPRVATIHVDELVDAEKEDKFAGIMDKDKDGNPIVVKRRLKKFIYNNKLAFRAFMQFKSMLVGKKVRQRIAEYEQMGMDAVIIDSIYLKYLDIFKDLNVRVLMRREYYNRLISVLERDKGKDMDKERFVISDMPYKKGYYKEDMKLYKYIVQNTTLDNLQKTAKQIYDREIKRRDINEACRVDLSTREKNKQRDIDLRSRANKSSRQQIEREGRDEDR